MIKIAVDGPGGAGKSLLARNIAKKLGYIYVDTGALYRAVGLYMKRRGVDVRDSAAVVRMLPGVTLSIEYREENQIVILCGEEVEDALLRTPEISMYASAVSAIGQVRELLLDTQRHLAEKYNVVMDGRDIGTVIFPDAQCKIFLTASDEVRAMRRFEELRARGDEGIRYEDVLGDMRRRDKNDSTRKIAPAIPADDAVILDNSDIDADGTLEEALKIIASKGVKC